jgi:AcrR family transcriptional regulator
MAKGAQALQPELDQASTRETILQAAIRQFADHGFTGTSLRDIGKVSGVNFQSIRYHYGSKEDLWEYVVAHLTREALQAGIHHEQAIASLPPAEQLKAQVRALVAHQVANPDLMRVMIREAMRNSDRYRKLYPVYIAPFYELAEKFLKRMQKEKVIDPNIPIKSLVMIFRGAMDFRMIVRAESELYTKKSMQTEAAINEHADAISQLLLAKPE